MTSFRSSNFLPSSFVMSSQVLNGAFMASRGMLGGAPIGLGAPVPYDGAFFPYQRNATVVDNVPHDILHMIHEHWYQFPPMNPLWHSLVKSRPGRLIPRRFSLLIIITCQFLQFH